MSGDYRDGAWAAAAAQVLRRHQVHLVTTVPDAGLTPLLERLGDCPDTRVLTLTNEAEGVSIATGAWLGGRRSILLMQSSGVGNTTNYLGLPRSCGTPLLMLVTMRGEPGEGNPWQVPMGSATPRVLEAMGVQVRRADSAAAIAPLLDAAAREAFATSARIAVLISQAVIGIKPFPGTAA